MKLKRDQIKDFDIPKEVLKELLDNLEEELKEVETKLDDKVVYGVINNIIKDKYVNKREDGTLNKEFLSELTTKIIKGEGDKRLITIWYELSNKILNSTSESNEMTAEEAFNIEYGVKL